MRKICMYAIFVVSLRRNLISKQQRLMKRSILFTIALLMIAVMVSAKQYQVTASKLNVRNAPDTSGKVVGSLSQNATVEVNRISGGWAEITFKGQKAYISAQYITPVKAAAKSTRDIQNPAMSIWGFLFVKTDKAHRNELQEILNSDLTEFII